MEINNLANLPESQPKIEEMMTLMYELHTANDDTASLKPRSILPLAYDYKLLHQHPDEWQPEYTLTKYFKDVDLVKVKKLEH